MVNVSLQTTSCANVFTTEYDYELRFNSSNISKTNLFPFVDPNNYDAFFEGSIQVKYYYRVNEQEIIDLLSATYTEKGIEYSVSNGIFTSAISFNNQPINQWLPCNHWWITNDLPAKVVVTPEGCIHSRITLKDIDPDKTYSVYYATITDQIDIINSNTKYIYVVNNADVMIDGNVINKIYITNEPVTLVTNTPPAYVMLVEESSG